LRVVGLVPANYLRMLIGGPRKRNAVSRKFGAFALAFAMSISPVMASDRSVTFRIPPVNIPLKIKDQQATIVASALITLVAQNHGVNDMELKLTADLSDLQQNATGLLSSALDKDERCGDRVEVENATLTPLAPALLAAVQLHYERWACVKLFGKEQTKRLIGGNAMIHMKLTPVVDAENTELRLLPEVGPISADGSLGELLRSGAVGQMLRDKIQSALQSAMKKGTELDATLPPSVRGYAKIKNAEFENTGSVHLAVVLDGEIQITNEQLQTLSRQARERIASH